MNPRPLRRSALVLAALVVGAGLAPACARRPVSGPPQLRVGRDECARCGMLILEDRCAAALLVERNGVRERAVFDDIGCMLVYERERKARVIDRFVRDYDARQWAPANGASFLLADRDRLRTPMGSGIVAFASREHAEAARARFGGEAASFDSLASAGDERIWRRSPAPDAPAPAAPAGRERPG